LHTDEPAEQLRGRHKGPDQQHIHRKAGTAAHQGRDEDGNHAIAAGLNCPLGHDARNGASKGREQGNERFAIETYEVHPAIQQKGRSSHVPAVFQNG
jgi:hypothetical protein